MQCPLCSARIESKCLKCNSEIFECGCVYHDGVRGHREDCVGTKCPWHGAELDQEGCSYPTKHGFVKCGTLMFVCGCAYWNDNGTLVRGHDLHPSEDHGYQ